MIPHLAALISKCSRTTLHYIHQQHLQKAPMAPVRARVSTQQTAEDVTAIHQSSSPECFVTCRAKLARWCVHAATCQHTCIRMLQWQLNTQQPFKDGTHTSTRTDKSTSSLPIVETVFSPATKTSRSKPLLLCSNFSYSSYSDICHISSVGLEHSLHTSWLTKRLHLSHTHIC